jgi:hypothetical protein
VAGHTVIVESPDPLDVVAGKALELFRATEANARRIPTGFAASGGQAERASPEADEWST